MSGSPHRHHALNALFEALGSVVVPNSCDLVVLAGRLDPERLRAAITTTLARHPVLRGLPFELRFHTLVDADPSQVDAHLLGLIWGERFAAGVAPVRFLVTAASDRSYLQTIHTHVYADATACHLLTDQIAADYAGLPPEPAAGRSAEPEAATRRKPGLARRVRGVLQTLRDLATPFAGLATPRGAAPGDRRLARHTFTPDETEHIRLAARARGCSMHALFQLAFLRTATAFNRRRGAWRPRLRLWDFFSVRPLREGGASSYDCLALVYPVELDARWSDEQVLARCADKIRHMRAGEILEHDARFDGLFAVFGELLPLRWFAGLWPSLFKTNILLTNPGVCPSRLPSFGDVPVLEYVTFPQLFAPAELLLVFSTFRDGLRVLAVYDRDALGASFHRELFAPFLRALGDLAGLDLSAVRTSDGFVARWAAADQQGRVDGD